MHDGVYQVALPQFANLTNVVLLFGSLKLGVSCLCSISCQVDDCFSLLGVMPAYSANDDAMATKVVSVYPQNPPECGTHIAWILHFDTVNGSLLAVSRMDYMHTLKVKYSTKSSSSVFHMHTISLKCMTCLPLLCILFISYVCVEVN